MAQRIGNAGDLNALREQVRSQIALRTENKEMRMTVHMGTCGIAAGAREVMNALIEELSRSGGEAKVALRQSGCAGLCDQEPMLTLTDAKGREWRYGRLNRTKIHEIVESHIRLGQPVDKYLIHV